MLMSTVAAIPPTIQGASPATLAISAAIMSAAPSLALTVGSTTGSGSLSITAILTCLVPAIPGPVTITVTSSSM